MFLNFKHTFTCVIFIYFFKYIFNQNKSRIKVYFANIQTFRLNTWLFSGIICKYHHLLKISVNLKF